VRADVYRRGEGRTGTRRHRHRVIDRIAFCKSGSVNSVVDFNATWTCGRFDIVKEVKVDNKLVTSEFRSKPESSTYQRAERADTKPCVPVVSIDSDSC
jgi:hypothetical protein